MGLEAAAHVAQWSYAIALLIAFLIRNDALIHLGLSANASLSLWGAIEHMENDPQQSLLWIAAAYGLTAFMGLQYKKATLLLDPEWQSRRERRAMRELFGESFWQLLKNDSRLKTWRKHQ